MLESSKGGSSSPAPRFSPLKSGGKTTTIRRQSMRWRRNAPATSLPVPSSHRTLMSCKTTSFGCTAPVILSIQQSIIGGRWRKPNQLCPVGPYRLMPCSPRRASPAPAADAPAVRHRPQILWCDAQTSPLVSSGCPCGRWLPAGDAGGAGGCTPADAGAKIPCVLPFPGVCYPFASSR
jgi:hypothetical protein